MSSTVSTEIHDPRELVRAFERSNELSLSLTRAYAALQARITEFGAAASAGRFAQRQAQVANQQLSDRLTGLLEILPAAVLLVDGRGRIDRFNRAAEKLFPNLAWGRLWREVLHERLVERVNDGEWLLAESMRVSVSRRVMDDRGQIMLLVDVTEQRQLEAQVQRQERLSAMGEMMAQLAHQIRTPLSAAVLYASQLASARVDAPEHARFGEKLLGRLRHTERLIADMLSFARGGRFIAAPMDLRRALREAVDTVGPRCSNGGASLEADFEGDGSPLTIPGNRDALIGVNVNLLNNAIDHGGSGVTVRIGLNTDDDRYRIVVSDNGAGVPADIRDRIFDPFFSTRDGGTGLGLAVAQAAALDHGGNVSCSDNPQGGATFELSLPRPRSDVDVWSKRT